MSRRHLQINYRQLSVVLIVLTVQIIIIQTIQVSAYSDARPPYYNSEDQDTLNNVRNLAPTIKWNDEQQDEDNLGAHSNAAQRRSSDNDLEDGLEEEDDEDRDEFKSGSSNHDSYENPAFGESTRAARDGEDIETFFDKHLGPQDAMEGSEPDSEVPINEMPVAMTSMNRAGRVARGDPDDHYEEAASSPLSSIFHSILNAHKRPLVITTSDDSPSDAGQQQSTSSSTPVGSSIRGANYVDQARPIAYLTPIAASPIGNYEQQAGGASNLVQAQTETGSAADGAGQEEYAPVREIYISRRPSLLSGGSHQHVSQQEQYHPGYSTMPRLVQQSSNAHWRGAHSMATHRPYPAAEDQYDYGRYPVAASYAYQREQAQPEDEQTTVSYGLSFGASPTESNDEQSADNNSPDDQSSIDEPAYAPHQSRNMMRHISPTRAYANYNYPPTAMMVPAGGQQAAYVPARAIQALQAQQQAPYHGARYHKDPSESAVQPITNYGQYSGASSNLAKDTRWATRQQLLASLDKEIKANPHYRQQQQQQQQAATTPNVQYTAQQSGRRSTAAQPEQGQPKRLPAGAYNDVDTYSSFHTEIDPYKSVTSSAQIIAEPVRQGTPDVARKTNRQSGDHSKNNAEDSNKKAGSHQIIRQRNQQQQAADLLTGPLINVDPQRHPSQQQGASDQGNKGLEREQAPNLRVRRENSDDRDDIDPDDDGVWVDDDEDDDGRQHSSSDLNETSQRPEDEENGQQETNTPNGSVSSANPSGVVGGPHSYELSPDDLMVYAG